MNKSLKSPSSATAKSELSLFSAVPALDPHVLHDQAQASVRALFKAGESANTRRSYEGALRYWAGWFKLRYRQDLTLPLPVPVVLQFLVDHVVRIEERRRVHDLPPAIDAALVAAGIKAEIGAPKLSTVNHRLSVLAKAHDLREQSNPTRAPEVQELVRRIRRAHAKRGELPKPKQAITRDALEAMLATCNDGLIGVRDRALLLFAWASGGRRRSEVTQATLEDLVPIEGGYLYRMGHSKTNQAGSTVGNEKPVIGVAGKALKDWLKQMGPSTGQIFRRIRGDCVAEPLTPQAVRAIVKRRVQLAGLEGDFSAHSLRSGFMTEAGRQNAPLGEAMALTGHRSVQTAVRYFQIGQVERSRAANMLGDASDTQIRRKKEGVIESGPT